VAELNVGRAVRDRLIGEHGFEETGDPYFGTLRKVVDSQRALIFEDHDWDRSSEGGSREVSAQLKIARRDVNELRAYVSDDGWDSWGATFDVTKEISVEWLDRPDGWSRFSAFAGTEAQVDPWLESWISRFVDEGPRMPLLYTILERAKINPNKVGASEWQVWMTAMLDGWTEADEQQFLIPKDIALRERTDLDEDQRFRLRGRVERTRAWVAEHPDGIERELMD